MQTTAPVEGNINMLPLTGRQKEIFSAAIAWRDHPAAFTSEIKLLEEEFPVDNGDANQVLWLQRRMRETWAPGPIGDDSDNRAWARRVVLLAILTTYNGDLSNFGKVGAWPWKLEGGFGRRAVLFPFGKPYCIDSFSTVVDKGVAILGGAAAPKEPAEREAKATGVFGRLAGWAKKFVEHPVISTVIGGIIALIICGFIAIAIYNRWGYNLMDPSTSRPLLPPTVPASMPK